jgi:hypothetical protein
LPKRRNDCLCFGIVGAERHQSADPSHAFGLLRPCLERPRNRRAAEERDEIAPLHVSPR